MSKKYGISIPFSDYLVIAAGFFVSMLTTQYRLPLMDDVYITIRHTENLLHGHGLLYNLGESLLGATSPLYTLLLAIPGVLGVDLISAALALWVLTLTFSGYLLYRVLDRSALGIVLSAILIVHPSLHSIQGMETALFVLLGFSLILALQKNSMALGSFILGLLWMTRPDGIFFVALLLVYALVTRRNLVRSLAPFLLIVIVWSLILYSVYGFPIPHTAVAKYYQGKITWWWPDHATFAKQFTEILFEGYAVALIAALLGAFVWLIQDWRKGRATNESWLILGVAIWATAYGAAYSLTHVPAYKNYFFPFFAMLFLAFGMVMNKTFKSHLHVKKTVSIIVILLSFSAAGSLAFTPTNLFSSPTHKSSAYREIGEWLRQNVPANDSVGAVEIGILGYYSKSKIVDYAGLVSFDVAKQVAAGNLRYATEHYRPKYVVARTPKPLELEGGLTKEELRGGYIKRFEKDSIGVFERVAYNVDNITNQIQTKLADISDAVLIPHFPLPKEIEAQLRERLLEYGGSLNDFDRENHKLHFHRLVFYQGTVSDIVPLFEPQTDIRREPLHFNLQESPLTIHTLQGTSSSKNQNGTVIIKTNGNDGQLGITPFKLAPAYYKYIQVKMRVTPISYLERFKTDEIYIHWYAFPGRGWESPSGTAHVSSKPDGEIHTYEFDLSTRSDWRASEMVAAFRIDPAHFPAIVEIKEILFK